MSTILLVTRDKESGVRYTRMSGGKGWHLIGQGSKQLARAYGGKGEK